MSPLIASLLLLAIPAPDAAVDPIVWHPHFNRTVEVKIRNGPTMKVSHITVTFNKEGFEKMKPGGAWHLGNTHFETSEKVTVGGQTVAAGKHSIKGRKKQDGTWELVIGKASRFSSRISDDAKSLKTEFVKKASMMEHLNVDIHPTGEKSSTTMWLVVHFNTYICRSKIDIGG